MDTFTTFLITYDVHVDPPGDHTMFKDSLIEILNQVGHVETTTVEGPLPNTTLLFHCREYVSCEDVFNYITKKQEEETHAVNVKIRKAILAFKYINTYNYDLHNIMITPAFVNYHFYKPTNHQ